MGLLMSFYNRHPFLWGVGMGCTYGCLFQPFATFVLAVVVLVVGASLAYALIDYWWVAALVLLGLVGARWLIRREAQRNPRPRR